jgi:hypothetical protein
MMHALLFVSKGVEARCCPSKSTARCCHMKRQPFLCNGCPCRGRHYCHCRCHLHCYRRLHCRCHCCRRRNCSSPLPLLLAIDVVIAIDHCRRHLCCIAVSHCCCRCHCRWPLPSPSPSTITVAMPLAISESCCLGAARIVFNQLKQRMLTLFYFFCTVSGTLIKAG